MLSCLLLLVHNCSAKLCPLFWPLRRHRYVVCAVAENKQLSHKVAAKLEAMETPLDPGTMGYDDMRGIARLRAAFCRMMEATAINGADSSTDVTLDPANLTISSGCGSLVEAVTWCVTEPGDAVIIPSPYYPAFDNDCVVRAACTVVPAETDHALYRLTLEALEDAAAKAAATGKIPKLLILTNPSNPLGTSYSEVEIVEATQW